jgi:hypothetical protein
MWNGVWYEWATHHGRCFCKMANGLLSIVTKISIHTMLKRLVASNQTQSFQPMHQRPYMLTYQTSSKRCDDGITRRDMSVMAHSRSTSFVAHLCLACSEAKMRLEITAARLRRAAGVISVVAQRRRIVSIKIVSGVCYQLINQFPEYSWAHYGSIRNGWVAEHVGAVWSWCINSIKVSKRN